MKIISIHQPEHLPWLGFIHKVMNADEFVLLDNVQYKKRYFQNRNKIRTQKGWVWLGVPIKKFTSTQKINEIKIDNSTPWQTKNLRIIKNNYAKTKYFKDYFSDLKWVYQTKYEYLSDLNIALIKHLLKTLKINTPLYVSSEILEDIGQGGTKVNLNLCKKLKATVYLSGAFGKDYLDLSKFEKENIKVKFQDFKHPIYKQLYEPFIPNMSIIDLLFNYGKDSLNILNRGGIK